MLLFKIALVAKLALSLVHLNQETDVLEAGYENSESQVVIETPLLDEEYLRSFQPNELGQVMVVMYHNLVEDEKKEGYYARTPENLKKDLIRFHLEGYVPITMTEFIRGEFNVEAGKTPIVLTFDDGHPTNFNYLEDGSINPRSVIGVFTEVEKEYEGFKGKAIFYVNQPVVFGNAPIDNTKVTYLLENGYELGNHTADHTNLTDVGLEKQHQTITKQAAYLFELNGQTDFHFSVPFGQKPEAYFDLVKGSEWLNPYQMISSVNVGWNPVKSPFHNDFDAYNLNRVTVGDDEFELTYWLDYFKKNPTKRFISDGDQSIITIKRNDESMINQSFMLTKRILMYDDGGVVWKTN